MKKLLCLLAASLIMLTACGNDNTQDAPDNNNSMTNEAVDNDKSNAGSEKRG